MRISDWSSDVALPISVDLGGGEVVQLQFVQSGVKGGAGQGRIAHAFVFSCNLLSVAGGSFFARRIWSRTTTTRSAAPARLRLHCGKSSRVAPAARRSEEHTYELQSLMRISYAVFCLNKQYTNSLRLRR